jgi:hypothetical protein
MVARLSAMTRRSAAGTIESIMVDLYREGDAERGAGLPPPGFVAMSRWPTDGVVCIGVAVSAPQGPFYFVRFDLRVRTPRPASVICR